MTDDAFRRDQLCFEQNVVIYRDMNRIMWQLPFITVAITAALWWVALGVPGTPGRSILLVSGILDFAGMAVLFRVRSVMSAYMGRMRSFHPPAFVEMASPGRINWSYTLLAGFSLSLAAAGLCSFAELIWLH